MQHNVNCKFGKIHKAIYCLNQASRKFYRRITTYLLKIGFTKSHIEPCLLRHASRQLFLDIYVSDVLTVGATTDVRWFSKLFEAEFEVRTSENVTEYIGTQILPLSKSSLFLHQSRLVEALLDDYHDLLGSPVKTPGVPSLRMLYLLATMTYPMWIINVLCRPLVV